MLKQSIGLPFEPSRIVLGSVYFGSDIDEKASFAVLDSFIEAGGNFLDTAHVYAAWLDYGVGASERTIGAWIQARRNRDHICLATKGGHPPIGGADHGQLSYDDLDRHITESLDRLGLESIDLYWLHRDEPSRPVEEIIESLAALRRSGRLRSYGASNWTTDRIERANTFAAERGLPGFVASQPWFSLGSVARGPQEEGPCNEEEDPLRRWHLRTQLPMIPYSSQANGYFGAENVDWAQNGFNGPPLRAGDFDSPCNRRRLLRSIELSHNKNCTANQIALAYLLSQPFPIYPIIGTSNPDHAREALDARAITLTGEERAFLLA